MSAEQLTEEQRENNMRLLEAVEKAKAQEIELYGRELTGKELAVVMVTQMDHQQKSTRAIWAHLGADV